MQKLGAIARNDRT